MAPVSIKKTIQQYRSLAQRLEAKVRQLQSKKEELESRAFVVIDETPSPVSSPAQNQALHESLAAVLPAGGARRSDLGGGRDRGCTSPPSLTTVAYDDAVERDSSLAVVGSSARSGNALVSSVTHAVPWQERSTPLVVASAHHLVEERVMAHSSDITSLVSAATNILIESTQLRLSHVQDVIAKLTEIQDEKNKKKAPTPPELLFSRYEEWVQRNQRLIELNVQLFDLEKLKFELKEKRAKVQSLPRIQEGKVDRVLSGGCALCICREGDMERGTDSE